MNQPTPKTFFLKKIDKYLGIPLFITFVSVFIIIATFLVLINTLPKQLPIFYSLAWGEQLAAKNEVLILPAVLIGITLLNALIAYQLHDSQIIFRRMLLLSIILMDLIVLFAFILVIKIFI